MDHAEAVRRFKEVFQRNGIAETEEEPFFRKADPEKLTCLTGLYGTFRYWSSVYLDGELETLKKYRVPDSVIEFYRQYEPNHPPMTEAGVHLCDLDGIREENSSRTPGGVLIRYGLLTIATTIGGMAVCIDLNTQRGRIVLVDNSDCCDVDCVEGYQAVKEIAHTVASDFDQFLWKLSGDEYDDFEDTFLDE